MLSTKILFLLPELGRHILNSSVSDFNKSFFFYIFGDCEINDDQDISYFIIKFKCQSVHFVETIISKTLILTADNTCPNMFLDI